MRIEARDGLLDSSGGEVEQTELAHRPQRAPHAGSASWVSPVRATSGGTHPLTAKGHVTSSLLTSERKTQRYLGRQSPEHDCQNYKLWCTGITS